ncbi:MAG: hypothetical protein ABSA05_09470 [Opitutaceae bacterium]
MSFEDMQKAWDNQPIKRDPALAVAELGRIRAGERRFKWLTAVAAFRDGAVFVLFAGMVTSTAADGRPPGALVAITSAIFFLGMAIILISSGSVIRDLIGGIGALADRVGRDSVRFRRIVLWRNFREVFCWLGAGLIVARYAPRQSAQHPAPHWAAVFCIAMATALYLYRTLRIAWGGPRHDETVLGQLGLSAYYTRAQIRLLENLWWLLAPTLGAVFLMEVPRVLAGRTTWRSLLLRIPVAVCALFAVWAVNRWLANSRLRPRLEHLEGLRADLLKQPGAESNPSP